MKRAILLQLLCVLAMRWTGVMAQSDICGAGAILLSCGSTVSGNTTAFTVDAAPVCGGVVNGTAGGVWYRILGTGSNITVSLCASSYNTALRIYTGACAGLVCVAGNDDFCGVQSQVTWLSTAATNYYILVHGNGAAVGAYSIDVSCAPSMDTCNPTMPVVLCGDVVSGNTTPFTVDAAPACSGIANTPNGGVWYTITGTGANITASLCGSAFNTLIRVYSGTCAALVCVIGNNDFCATQSEVTWPSTLGTPYYILIHGFGGATGAYTLTITCTVPPPGMCYSTTVTPYVVDPFAGTAVFLSDDQHSGVVNIGFSFCYNGTSYTQCLISSNNYITFNTALAGGFSPWATVAVPTAFPTEIRNGILNPWQDLYPPAGGSIRYQTLGVSPNRRFVVSYQNVPMFSCTALLFTSQTVLYEGSNCIGSFLQTKPLCATWNQGHAVHAVHNGAGTLATVVAGRNNTAWIATSEGRYFTPTCAPCSTAVTTTCSVPLPIELLHFTGHRAGTANILEWATASEQNTDRFTVERSDEGAAFEPIFVVQAAGNSHAVIDYTGRDEAPFHGVNYYRLRATDLDGSDELSDVISVNSIAPEGIILYPNPAEGSPLYQLPDGVMLPATLMVRDLAGRVVRSIVVDGPEGMLDVDGLAGGSYFLELAAPHPAAAVRFVISR